MLSGTAPSIIHAYVLGLIDSSPLPDHFRDSYLTHSEQVNQQRKNHQALIKPSFSLHKEDRQMIQSLDQYSQKRLADYRKGEIQAGDWRRQEEIIEQAVDLVFDITLNHLTETLPDEIQKTDDLNRKEKNKIKADSAHELSEPKNYPSESSEEESSIGYQQELSPIADQDGDDEEVREQQEARSAMPTSDSSTKNKEALWDHFWSASSMDWKSFAKLFNQMGFKSNAEENLIKFQRGDCQKLVFYIAKPRYDEEVGPNSLGRIRQRLTTAGLTKETKI